jgi:hypothetical protein
MKNTAIFISQPGFAVVLITAEPEEHHARVETTRKCSSGTYRLTIFLLMSHLSQTFLPFVCCHFVAFPFFTARH